MVMPICCVQIRGELRQGDKVVDTVSGSWLQHVEWDKGVRGGKLKRIWEVGRAPVRIPTRVLDPLPSDSRFREDLCCLQVLPSGSTPF